MFRQFLSVLWISSLHLISGLQGLLGILQIWPCKHIIHLCSPHQTSWLVYCPATRILYDPPNSSKYLSCILFCVSCSVPCLRRNIRLCQDFRPARKQDFITTRVLIKILVTLFNLISYNYTTVNIWMFCV